MTDHTPSVVVYIHDTPSPAPCPAGPAQSSGNAAGQNAAPPPGARRLDPHAIHKHFPERWSAYIRANFKDLKEVQRAFDVSERAARRWWTGEGGANGGYVAIAVDIHPEIAQRMLFAAE